MHQYLPQIREAFYSSFGTPPESVLETSVPDEIEGWDSLGHAVLTGSLEEIFDIMFDIDELMAMENVAEIIRVLSNKLESN